MLVPVVNVGHKQWTKLLVSVLLHKHSLKTYDFNGIVPGLTGDTETRCSLKLFMAAHKLYIQ